MTDELIQPTVHHDTPKSMCHRCGKVHDAATSMTSDQSRPSAGDPTICWDCGVLGIYTEDGRRRPPTEAELDKLLADPDVMRAASAWRNYKRDLEQKKRRGDG